MRIAVLTPPSAEPITLAEAKAHLRVDSSDENTLIEALITSARQWVEAATNRAIGLQTLEIQRRGFTHRIELPRPPLRTVVSVKYLDSSNVEQTLALPMYYRTIEHTDCQPGYLELLENVTLPTVYGSDVSVRVRYQAGYDTTGSPADVVPAGLKQAMLILISEMYENREITVTGAIVQENKVIPALLSTFKVYSL
jgi:uncharacterized phiE125 gp8 family phage protein